MRAWGLRTVVALGLVVLTGIRADAEFHFAVIDEVMSGCGADPTMQYVEIRMLSAGQDVVGGSRLTAFSCDGSTINQLALIGSDLSNGMAGDRWIIASSSFQAASGIAADFSTLDGTPGIFPDCGQVCWGKPGAQSDSPGAYVDCLAYGPYTGPKGSSAAAATDVPNLGSQSLTRAGGDAFDNNFALAAPSPTNFSNQVGDLSACTPVSTTTTVAVATTSSTAGGGGSTTSTTVTGASTTTSTTTGPALRGGGAPKTDCFAEWLVAGATGTTPVVICTDNDPTCDTSAAAGCVIRTQICFNDAAAAAYGGKCTAAPVTAFALLGKPDATTAGAVANAISALPGAAGSSFSPPLSGLVCTGPIDLTVPLKVKGTKTKKGSLTIKSVATAGKKDKDKLKLVCVP